MNERKTAAGVLATAAVVAFCAHAAAQEPSLVTALKKKYGGNVTVQTSLDLEIFWKVREKTEKKSGLLYLAPGDRFRLELGNTVWVSDGRTYWQYGKATRQVVIKQLLDVDLSMHPSQIISTYLHDYSYEVKEQEGKQAVCAWRAPEGDTKAFANAITIWVDAKKLVLKKLHVVDRNGNESTYTFKKTKVGGAIPPGVFTFDVPEGVSVLDTRD